MQTLARVHEVRDGRARLACDAAGIGCGACAGGRGCAMRWLARPGGSLLEVEAARVEGMALRPGDGVIVEVADGELLRAAALAYLPPLVGLLAGPVMAAHLAPGGELLAIAATVPGLAAGWWVARLWLGRRPPRYRLRPAGAP